MEFRPEGLRKGTKKISTAVFFLRVVQIQLLGRHKTRPNTATTLKPRKLIKQKPTTKVNLSKSNRRRWKNDGENRKKGDKAAFFT